MSYTKALKVAVIGCGQVAQIEWLPYLHELDEYKVVALSDISQRLMDYYGDLYGIQKRYVDWQDAINDDEVQAVIILNGNHTEICLAAAKAKKDVLVEKPLCENPEQAAQIAQAVRQSGIILMVGEMKRYDPGYLYAKELIRKMKGLRMIRVRDFCDGLSASQPEIYTSRRRTDVPKEVKQKIQSEFDAGMKVVTGNLSAHLYFRLLMAGVHDIDIMRAAFGEPKGVQYCDIWDEGNLAVAILDYGDSVKAVVEVGYTDQKWFEEELVAFGTEQTIAVKFPHPYLKNCPTIVEVTENDNGAIVKKEISASFEESFRSELLHFYHCLTTRSEPETPVEEGWKDITLLSEIFKSYAGRHQD